MKKYFVSLAYEIFVDADDEESAIDIARAEIGEMRKIGADYDYCWAEETEP